MGKSEFGGRLWKPLAVIAAIAALAGVGQSDAGESAARLEKELVIVTSGGAFERALKEHFYEPFSKATGATIRSVVARGGEQWAKAKTMREAGKVEWDIVTASADDLISQRALLYNLGDCAAMPNVAAQGMPGACAGYGLVRTIGSSQVTYNTNVFPKGQHPRSWADFWDVKKFPGPRALPNAGEEWVPLAAALMADGVPVDQIRPPLDLDRAFRKLDELRPHVKVFWKTGDQSQQIMRDGEVVLSMMWSGRALNSKASGLPIDLEWNQAIADASSWAILKDAPHPKAALAFLNFFMGRPEAHLAFSRQMFYETSNRRALELLPEAERPTRALYGDNLKRMVFIDQEWAGWLAANQDRILERWNAWLVK